MRLFIVALLVLQQSVSCTTATKVHDGTNWMASSGDRDLIIGGENATSGEFPWFGRTSMFVTSSDGTTRAYVCGASLIHSDIVMSAAFCMVNYFDNTDTTSIDIKFNLGANLINGSDGVVSDVSDVYWPRSYALPDNNIIFYKLSTPSNVTPVAWNTDPSIPSVGEIGTTIGFGATSNGGPSSRTLLKVDIATISNAECRDYFVPGAGVLFIEQSMTCSYSPDKGICSSDFGGPILTQSGVIFGITSLYTNQGCEGSPSVFTRVSSYRDMIASVICEYSANPPTPCNGFATPNVMRTYQTGQPIQCGLFGIPLLCSFTSFLGGIVKLIRGYIF